MKIERHNAWSEITGAPKWFLDYAVRHLAVPVQPGQKATGRFGKLFWHQGQPWGSMVHGSRVPAGLTTHVCQLADYYKLPVEVSDVRQPPPTQTTWYSVRAPWRPYQDRVHAAVMKASTGVIDAPPRSGKTLMAARLIDALAQPAIYLAPSVQIVRQTHSVLVQHLGSDCVGRFDGGAALEDRNLNRPVVVATPNSALRFPAEFWDTRQLLVIDEFHHSAAEMYHAISALAKNTYYRFGFTGTHFRTGADRLAMEAVCSTTIEKITLQELIPQYIAPPRVFFMRTPGPRFVAEDFQNAYDEGIVQNEDRNTLVTKIVTQLQERGVPTIVLTRRRAHADALGARINDSLVVKGGENALTGRSVRAFLDGSCNVLIGTTVIGEGVDVPRAAALVFASGGNDGVSMLQAYFRPLTAYAGKDAGRIYDFWDRQQETLRRQSANRFKMAKTQFQSVFRVE